MKVGFCSVHGNVFNGHVLYFNTDGVNVAERAWQFMSQFTLPTTTPPSCTPVPASGCQPALSKKGVLKLGRGATPDKNKLSWKWVSSGSVVTSDFGDPTASTGYALCGYDQTERVMTATAAAGGVCAGKPCWALRSTGATYSDKVLTPDGLLKISLKAGAPGRAKIAIKGKGANLGVPPLPLAVPVRVQLQREGACWETAFGSATMNTAATFKGKSD